MNMNKRIFLDGRYVVPFLSTEYEIEFLKKKVKNEILYDEEISSLVAEIAENDPSIMSMSISTRQLAILLKFYMSLVQPKMINDIPWRERLK